MKSQISTITQPGANHTGIAVHPDLAAEMIEGAAEFGPTTAGGPDLIADARIRAAKRSQPAGTMPPSTDVPRERLPLLDRLGARLAFERTGVRLYEALISKLDAYGTYPGGPTRAELERICEQELAHFGLAQMMVVNLGGDPTVVTPFANIQATAMRGVVDVLVDPRTTLVECLEAILAVELVDRESWDHLVEVANSAKKELEVYMLKIREAERTEAEHLSKVRGWVAAAAQLATDTVH